MLIRSLLTSLKLWKWRKGCRIAKHSKKNDPDHTAEERGAPVILGAARRRCRLGFSVFGEFERFSDYFLMFSCCRIVLGCIGTILG